MRYRLSAVLAVAIAVAVTLSACIATASETVTAEPNGSSYHFVSHYSVDVNASVPAVWQHLVDVGSWMYEFDLSLESGIPGREGEVRRLYSGQEYFIEITKVIPGEVLVFANLPAEQNGEHSTGIAVITLSQCEGVTTVNLTMSRRYSRDSAEPNPLRLMRESPEFHERARAMWQDRFLGRLKSLAESE